MSTVQQLVEVEPWRIGQGQQVSALDPSVAYGHNPKLCDGEIEWEGTSTWWRCTKCGYCSFATFQQHHQVIQPIAFFMTTALLYVMKRAREGVPPGRAANQLLHIAGTALRYAAVVPAQAIGSYVNNLILR